MRRFVENRAKNGTVEFLKMLILQKEKRIALKCESGTLKDRCVDMCDLKVFRE